MSKRTQLLYKLKHVYSHNTKLVLDVENKDIELIIEALEKQIAKKMVSVNCPICRYYFEDGEIHNYCPKCGQKIDLE